MKTKDIIFLLALFVGFPALVVALFVFWFLGSFGDCVTKTDADISDLAGNDFEIATTHCSGFPTQAYRTVYAKKSGERYGARLFQYHPRDREPLPEIRMPEPDRIVIVAPWVKSSLVRLDHWEGMRIEYQTGENIDSAEGQERGPAKRGEGARQNGPSAATWVSEERRAATRASALKTEIYIEWTGVEMTLSWASERDYRSAKEFFADMGILWLPNLSRPGEPPLVVLEKEQQLDALYEFRRKLRER